MRLTCPNCGVEYEVAEGMVPAAGRHVQCTSCHTRWFVRGGTRAAASEDQILTRLETWRPRPTPVPAAVQAAPLSLVPDPTSEADLPMEAEESAGPEPTEPEAEVEVEAPPAPPADAVPDLAPAVAPPAVRPKPAHSAPLAGAAPPPSRPRLELGGDPAKAPPPVPPRSRFGRGFLTALVLALLALGAYIYRGPIVDRVPAAGPALTTYAGYVDKARDEVTRRYEQVREQAGL